MQKILDERFHYSQNFHLLRKYYSLLCFEQALMGQVLMGHHFTPGVNVLKLFFEEF